MKKTEILGKINSNIVLPVLRAGSADEAARIAEAVIAGGIESLEITMTIPDAPRVIEKLSEKSGDNILIGAGTVLNVEAAKRCLEAGSKFIVTPCLIPEVIEFCNQSNVPVLAGAFTATEVYAAWQAGADVVKIFPASLGGAGYLKALKAPFPHIKMMPTGGVSLENARNFLDAGAFALGIGGELINQKAENEADKMKKIREYSQKIKNLLRISDK